LGRTCRPGTGGGFTDAAMISLHCLRIYLNTTYRMTIDPLTEMPQICREIGLGVITETIE